MKKILKAVWNALFGKNDPFLKDMERISGGKLYETGIPGLYGLKKEEELNVDGRVGMVTHVSLNCLIHDGPKMVKMRDVDWVPVSRYCKPFAEDYIDDIRPALVVEELRRLVAV